MMSSNGSADKQTATNLQDEKWLELVGQVQHASRAAVCKDPSIFSKSRYHQDDEGRGSDDFGPLENSLVDILAMD